MCGSILNTCTLVCMVALTMHLPKRGWTQDNSATSTWCKHLFQEEHHTRDTKTWSAPTVSVLCGDCVNFIQLLYCSPYRTISYIGDIYCLSSLYAWEVEGRHVACRKISHLPHNHNSEAKGRIVCNNIYSLYNSLDYRILADYQPKTQHLGLKK